MSTSKMKAGLGIALSAAVAAGASGCLSMQSQSTLDGIQGAATNAVSPYVEGYVEYAGPQAKWSGPVSFVLHVTAKDAGTAQISVTPAFFGEKLPEATTSARAPASQAMSGETAREILAHLATAMQGTDQPFKGCLSPVRVRLTRADGSLLDKHGCRSQTGWPHTASDTVNQFITASVYGVPGRVPASLSATTPAAGTATGAAANAAAKAAAVPPAAKGKADDAVKAVMKKTAPHAPAMPGDHGVKGP